MSEGHARLGPSNHRWPECAGSIREEERYPDVSGEAAIDGTGSHLLLEYCMEHNVPASAYIGQIIGANHVDNPNGWLINDDRCKRVQMALDYIARRVYELKEEFGDCDVIVTSETKSDPGSLCGRTDWWGTCDITIEVMKSEVCVFAEVADYKDGRLCVGAEDNTQLISYLMGKLAPYHDINVHPDNAMPLKMTVIQPKTNPVIRSQDVTYAELDKKYAELVQAAHRTDDPNAPLTAGKHCQWCKANPKRGGHCTAGAEDSMEVLKTMSITEATTGEGKSLFEIIEETFGDITKRTAAELADLADAKAALFAIFDKVDAEILTRVEQGIEVDGFAMKPGRGKRGWIGEEKDIVKMLKGRRLKQADIYPQVLISPAALLKLELLTDSQKKKIEEKFIEMTPGDLKLTKVARATKPEADEMFADVPTKAAAPTVPSFF